MKVPDLDDIIFEKRNKLYGAYLLRRKYKRVLALSVFAVVILCTLLIIPFFIDASHGNKDNLYIARYVATDNLLSPKEDLLVVPPPPPPPQPKGSRTESFLAKSIKYVPPVVVDSFVSVEIKKESNINNTRSVSLNTYGNIKGSSNGNNFGTGSTNGVVGGTGIGDIYSTVEVMPVFKGGDIEKFREWVLKRIKYPKEAMVNNIEGIVYISFVIELDGTVSNVKVVKGIDPILDKEAIKTVESSPKWTPGKQKGKSVRVLYMIPINFKL